MVHSKTPWANRLKKERFKRKYLSKMQAQRLLQVDSMTFRRLCILKGVYPRSISRSRQKDSGNAKQYYLTREVKWLVRDDIRDRMAAFDAWQKKIRRAKAMHRFQTLEILNSAKKRPEFRLDATIKERYPTFHEAVQDIDDAMTMISLYASLSPEVNADSTMELHQALPSGLHAKARHLVADWMDYIAKSHSLSKSFISIKGYYHEAIINGERVIWQMPHEYSSRFPSGVQEYILISFLEFYVELMRFILFKLRNDLDKEIAERDRNEDDLLTANAESFDPLVDVGALSPARRAESNKKKFLGLWRDARAKISNLFSKFVFYVSREVPRKQCRLVIEACGGTLLDEYNPKVVTHFICDRPTLPPGFEKRDDTEYLQPQYLFDCLNARVVLPVEGYRMGEELPSHVSPFAVALSGEAFDIAEVEEVKKNHPRILGYVPQRVHEIRRIKDPLYTASDAMCKPLDQDAAAGGGPNGNDDDADSLASEEHRIALEPEMGAGDVELDDADIAALPRRAQWEDEQVHELPSRSAVSALKVQKQRELNQMNRPTSDAAAQRRADAVEAKIRKLRAEPEDKRKRRRQKQAKSDQAAREKMKLQVTRKKAARYYRMIKGTQKNMEKKEEILARKAAAIKKGNATTSGKMYTSEKDSREAEKLRAAKSSSDPKVRKAAMSREQKKKAKADPYRKLPKWTR